MTKDEFIEELIEREVVHMYIDYYETDDGKPISQWISIKYKDGSTDEIERRN